MCISSLRVFFRKSSSAPNQDPPLHQESKNIYSRSKALTFPRDQDHLQNDAQSPPQTCPITACEARPWHLYVWQASHLLPTPMKGGKNTGLRSCHNLAPSECKPKHRLKLKIDSNKRLGHLVFFKKLNYYNMKIYKLHFPNWTSH